jgi:valyl-tRNA synthetase
MEMAAKYNPAEVESKWYAWWMEQGLFHSEPDEREPYTVVIPPPNVTGVLHMGHMLNNTIQDVLVRRARMQGKNACWVPGTDHASIATEAKVVAKLAAEGIRKQDLTREQFLEHAWEWTRKHGGIILEQLKKLGASCDWERTNFTMNEAYSRSVIRVFVDLFRKGKIYRGVRMVNWDPQALTAVSDEEVVYKEQQGKLYYVRYEIKNPLTSPLTSPLTPNGGTNAETNISALHSSPFGGGGGLSGGGLSTPPRYQTARNSSYNLLKELANKSKSSPTDAENILWGHLKGKQLENYKFRRQHIIDEFIVDFVCLSHKLVIEVDGGYHNHPEVAEADKLRTEILEELGYTVIRFTNEEIFKELEKVLTKILSALHSSPFGGGGGLSGGGDFLIVATTRPETIMGDTAVAIHPDNPKTAHLKGKTVIVPLVNREVPVIEDEYVDMEFGTGCLKVTPAHDINDYLLGEKHRLEVIDIFNDNGTLNEKAQVYVGQDRFAVRRQIEKDLAAAGLLEKVEIYTHKVGYSERTDVPIEPKLSMQWFVKMAELAAPALEAVENDDVQLYPPKFKNTYRHWMENIKDWCISRQLWWGHRIPAWYLPGGGFVVAENEAAALQLAREQTKNKSLTAADLRQDNDCLDTWFSSWLWPVSVFDPDVPGSGEEVDPNRDLQYYYPTSDLVTAPEILFFWVARMIIAGYEWAGGYPFKNVYLTGIVRDHLGRKMSKQLGNSPDPVELMNKYGADGVRMGMLLTSPAGNDLPFDEALCEQGRNFCNKIWNAFRLVKGWQPGENTAPPAAAAQAVEWFRHAFRKTLIEINDDFEKYRLSEALMKIYKLFWDDFCAWYLEIIKPQGGAAIDKTTLDTTLLYFDCLLRVLHPFMPFITEEIWQRLAGRQPNESLMVQLQPYANEFDATRLSRFEQLQHAVTALRTLRQSKNISPKEPLELYVKGAFDENLFPVLQKIANLCAVHNGGQPEAQNGYSFLVDATEFFVPLGALLNVEEERKKLTEDLAYQQKFVASIRQKLRNEKFVQQAPEQVVALERKKLSDGEARIKAIEEQLAALGK